MITDKLKNIDLYNIPKEAIDFVKSLTKNETLGRKEISENIYANIEEYQTKILSNATFEAHEKYIDIQVLLKGSENIYYTDKSELTISKNYDEKKDITFYTQKVDKYNFATLNSTNFVLLYPHEAHAPQVAINECPTPVKKLVIKVKV